MNLSRCSCGSRPLPRASVSGSGRSRGTARDGTHEHAGDSGGACRSRSAVSSGGSAERTPLRSESMCAAGCARGRSGLRHAIQHLPRGVCALGTEAAPGAEPAHYNDYASYCGQLASACHDDVTPLGVECTSSGTRAMKRPAKVSQDSCLTECAPSRPTAARFSRAAPTAPMRAGRAIFRECRLFFSLLVREWRA